ncbi:hypothetical protein OH76DRAFT_1417063 [Lentinus brumalis]|uniref:Uncharacterized protein n=1 Tax=Lentinus brumalis TaxID=2498619 RepID=A0A371DGK0_9APHY|nr:hypothetical protein OH76DRAFT_1417063 [Polyporus brumalis]
MHSASASHASVIDTCTDSGKPQGDSGADRFVKAGFNKVSDVLPLAPEPAFAPLDKGYAFSEDVRLWHPQVRLCFKAEDGNLDWDVSVDSTIRPYELLLAVQKSFREVVEPSALPGHRFEKEAHERAKAANRPESGLNLDLLPRGGVERCFAGLELEDRTVPKYTVLVRFWDE